MALLKVHINFGLAKACEDIEQRSFQHYSNWYAKIFCGRSQRQLFIDLDASGRSIEKELGAETPVPIFNGDRVAQR